MDRTLTVEHIAHRFAEAAHTARRLPAARVQGHFNSWPEFRREAREALAGEDAYFPRFPPSPAAVDRMIETTRWMQSLDVGQRQIIWMRARNDSWKEISCHLACDRTTAWRRWQTALRAVADTLNGPHTEGCALIRTRYHICC